MKNEIVCTICGTQYNKLTPGAEGCPICNDDRQYVPEAGQIWTSLAELQESHSVIAKKLKDNLYELKMAPTFSIGQRAMLVLTPGGNILWDCIALLNEPTIEFIRAKGGLKAIVFSHPHYYTTMNEWASVFDCPVYIHQKDEQWVFNKGPHIRFWDGAEEELWDGVRIMNIGGHFPGSSILHVPFLSPNGTVLCGDTFYISLSKTHFSVMYSYPNRIPLPISEVREIKNRMMAIPFDTMHGFLDDQNVYDVAKEILSRSLEQYV